MFDNRGMGISHFIKDIGRGKHGARDLSRDQAHELMGQVLDGRISDLELGAFCVAMRIKGETPLEMAGFLDAVHERLALFPNTGNKPVLVLPSYNGSRRLPLLTPLLALLLAREGWPVLVHGGNTEDQRIATAHVMQALNLQILDKVRPVAEGEVVFAPTSLLSPGLWRLLEVRRSVGLRNPGHSMVKLMNPVKGLSLRVASYTHPEYAVSMRETLELLQASALLLRGTEGEPVADFRRTPNMLGFVHGALKTVNEHASNVVELHQLPNGLNVQDTAQLIQNMMQNHIPTPLPIQWQVQTLDKLARQLSHP